MSINKRIIVDIPFNIDFGKIYNPSTPNDQKKIELRNRRFQLSQTHDWISYRIKLLMDYTLSSLKNQSSQNFLCLIRHTEETASFINNELQKYPALPPNFIFTSHAHDEIYKALKSHDYLYHVRIDSDNMYDCQFINRIDTLPYTNDINCILCQNGYIYDHQTKRLATIFHHSPSLYVYICHKNNYVPDEEDFLFFGNHFQAEKRPHTTIKEPSYVLVTHDKNLDNDYDIICKCFRTSQVLDESAKKAILSRYMTT